MTEEADAMLGGSKIPPFKFEKPGDTITGLIEATEVMQQRDFLTNEPEFWANGQAKEQVVFTLQTTLRDDDDDDGRRKVYAKYKLMQAIQAAIVRGKFKKPFANNGYTLTVTHTKVDKPEKQGMSGAKLYSAELEQADYDPGTEPF